MYAMDHTTHFEHRIEARPTRRFRRRDMAWASRPASAINTSLTSRTDTSDREQPDGSWPFPEFAD